MWAQRSKVQWLRDGGKNTRFFHTKATQRRRRNYIKGLYDENGQCCTHPSRVTDTVVQFYQKLFTSCESVDFEEILEQIPTKVTEDMNVELLKEFTTDEVENALKHMAPLKSPGPDGMPQLFYQSYWSLVGPEVQKQSCCI